ncbi:carbohydrate kinase [Tricholoma matsutake]|nr:carbohydrate kinase [Tricholoma matsutake 945]
MPSTDAMTPQCVLIVIMGVSGTGKSTLGNALAKTLGIPYVEGDDLHPKSNVEKMSSGHPLDDADREPWLELIRNTAERKVVQMQADTRMLGIVVGCSALKRYYRDILRGIVKPVMKDQKLPENLNATWPNLLSTYFVFIDGSREILMERMEKRTDHFMKASMLESQLRTLENPVGEEGVVVVSLHDATNLQIKQALDGLMRFPGFDLVDRR